MNIFSKLMGKIFGKDEEKTAPASKTKDAAPAASPVVPEVKDTSVFNPGTAPDKATDEARAAAQKALVAQAKSNSIDVAKHLDALAKARAKEGIDWRKSIVDLMKICGMDSSYDNRAALAEELGYPKDKISKSHSAKMNIWLHKEMMRQIIANGGKVPGNLLD